MLIKVRGHAGIPGNEHADDIATTVAATGQAEVDLSTVESNSRPFIAGLASTEDMGRG